MTEVRNRIGSVRSTASTVKDGAVELLTTIAVSVGLTVWSLFWANLARVHYAQGDLPSALFTAAVFVGPGVAALVWYLGETFGVDADVPTPSIDTELTSS